MSGYNIDYAELDELRQAMQAETDAEALEQLQETWEQLRQLVMEATEACELISEYGSELAYLNREIDLYTQKEQRRLADRQAAARFQALNARAAQDRARQILRNRKRLPRYRTKQRRGPTECD